MSTYSSSTVSSVTRTVAGRCRAAARACDERLARLADEALPTSADLQRLLGHSALVPGVAQAAAGGQAIREALTELERLDPGLRASHAFAPESVAKLRSILRSPTVPNGAGFGGDLVQTAQELRTTIEQVQKAASLDERLTTAYVMAEALRGLGYHVATSHAASESGLAGIRKGELLGIQLVDGAPAVLDFAGCAEGVCVDRMAEVEDAFASAGIVMEAPHRVRHDDRRGGALLAAAGPLATARTPSGIADAIVQVSTATADAGQPSQRRRDARRSGRRHGNREGLA